MKAALLFSALGALLGAGTLALLVDTLAVPDRAAPHHFAGLAGPARLAVFTPTLPGPSADTGT